MNATLLALIALSAPSFPQTIDFERYPDGSLPGDRDSVDVQFASRGVTFSLVKRCRVSGQPDDPRLCLPPEIIPNRFPRIAVVGAPETAFTGVNLGQGCADQPQASASVGRRFLSDGALPGLQGNLLISYATPVESASGEILDIDTRPGTAFEEWTVLGLDQFFGIVSEQVLRAPAGPDLGGSCQGGRGPGDGGAFTWSIESPRRSFEIHHILIAYTGSPGLVDTVGLAFDNFSPATNTCTGAWQRIGDPCKGTAVLTGSGCLKAGGTVRFEINGGVPNAHGCLLVSATNAAVPFHGCTIFLSTPLVAGMPHVLDGRGSLVLERKLPVTLSSPEYFLQAVHMLPSGNSFTNGLRAQTIP